MVPLPVDDIGPQHDGACRWHSRSSSAARDGDAQFERRVHTDRVTSSNATWASLSSDASTLTSGRNLHSMTALADGTQVLFGGYGSGFLNDVVHTDRVGGPVQRGRL